ncbi:MAG: uridine monophosphate kinase [Defluviitaleaceae bacterium]|nr:uridine monophosphate kinase [Defluviitaleaceae bacterium]
MFKRAVLKLSGEALSNTGGSFGAIGEAVVADIVRQVVNAMASGTQIAIVVGGGNFWRGRQALPQMDRVAADQIGMLATVMNAIYLRDAFERQGAAARVTTPVPFGRFTELFEYKTALGFMRENVAVINAAGLGHPFFSTDTVAAVRAAELSADCVLYAKNVDGVYDRDPAKHEDAKKYRTVSYKRAISDSLNAADMAALHISREAGIPSYVFGLREPDGIVRACSFPDTGGLEGTYLNNGIEEAFYG